MNFADLKKNSQKNLENLVKDLNNMKSTNKFVDDRFWVAPVDEKTGNGTALIRYLPAKESGTLPWTPELYSHSFQGPGGWYIENSLTTLGKSTPDPVSEANKGLWDSGVDANKEIVRKRKRKTTYVSNILVLSDPKNPENNGKVFLYRYGKKIFEKIQNALIPVFDTDTALDPFDFWAGANFRLKIMKVEGYPNYDNSQFENSSPLLEGNDKKLEGIWNSLYDLSEFTDPKSKHFKTYDELKARFERVVGNTMKKEAKPSVAGNTAAPAVAPTKTAVKQASIAAPWNSEPTEETEEDDDDTLSAFARLVEED